ncbi:hypothetical protein FQA39_LY04824 [Lamprigera yunnana]|nr:hypothetical protein FQA39_LY04824 [Lamprigera yunnana]
MTQEDRHTLDNFSYNGLNNHQPSSRSRLNLNSWMENNNLLQSLTVDKVENYVNTPEKKTISNAMNANADSLFSNNPPNCSSISNESLSSDQVTITSSICLVPKSNSSMKNYDLPPLFNIWTGGFQWYNLHDSDPNSIRLKGCNTLISKKGEDVRYFHPHHSIGCNQEVRFDEHHMEVVQHYHSIEECQNCATVTNNNIDSMNRNSTYNLNSSTSNIIAYDDGTSNYSVDSVQTVESRCPMMNTLQKSLRLLRDNEYSSHYFNWNILNTFYCTHDSFPYDATTTSENTMMLTNPSVLIPIGQHDSQLLPHCSLTGNSLGAAALPSVGCEPFNCTNYVEEPVDHAVSKKNNVCVNDSHFPLNATSDFYERENVGDEFPSNEHIEKMCLAMTRTGFCRKIPYCRYIHGDKCNICCHCVLHPKNQEERELHRQNCLAKYMEDNHRLMTRSQNKTCSICFDVILEKEFDERRFGILSNCNHCFCLSCIRRWRQARQFGHKVIKACPECRVTSDFVCPSRYWVETDEEKDNLIQNYKQVLANKACKYFREGRGTCPFGNKCFYLHALLDGSIADVGPPRPRGRRRYTINFDILNIDFDFLWDLHFEMNSQYFY